jgi:hypothetical protein
MNKVVVSNGGRLTDDFVSERGIPAVPLAMIWIADPPRTGN